jgi:hypothetical protein
MIFMKSLVQLLCVFAIGTVLTLGGLLTGYKIYSKVPKLNPDVYATEPIAERKALTVAADTVVRYVYTYTEDNEEVSFEEKAPDYLIGLTGEEVTDTLRDYELCEFTSDKLVLKKEIDGRSNAHYSIGEKDGYVAVFFDSGILKEKTATPIDGLDPKIKAQISKGIKIDGVENLARCLEDIES